MHVSDIYCAYRNSVNNAILRLFRYVRTDRTVTIKIWCIYTPPNWWYFFRYKMYCQIGCDMIEFVLIWASAFLAHLSWRLMGELIVYQSLRRPSVVRPSVCPSVRQHFQTSSLKPLGQLNSNFIWRLLRTRERKFVQMVLVTWPRWPPCPYMVKTL